MARSDITSRSLCIIPATQSARRHDQAGKFEHPTVQGWGAEHKPENSSIRRSKVGEQSIAMLPFV